MEGIDIDQWHAHAEEDKRQSADIREIMLLLKGDPLRPETVKCALMPTMMRLNAWLDMWKWIGGVMIGAGVSAPLWVPLLKMILRELAK